MNNHSRTTYVTSTDIYSTSNRDVMLSVIQALQNVIKNFLKRKTKLQPVQKQRERRIKKWCCKHKWCNHTGQNFTFMRNNPDFTDNMRSAQSQESSNKNCV